MDMVIKLYITDKTGKKLWRTTVTDAYSSGERNNLARHLALIKSRHPKYAGIADPETARIAEEFAL